MPHIHPTKASAIKSWLLRIIGFVFFLYEKKQNKIDNIYIGKPSTSAATQRVFPRRKKTQGKEQTVLFDLFRPGLFQRWIDGGQNSPSGKKEKREKNERVLYDSPWDM